MILSCNEGLHISAGVEHCQEASEGHIREERFVGVEWVQAKETLAHVYESLSDSNHEKLVLGLIHSIIGC